MPQESLEQYAMRLGIPLNELNISRLQRQELMELEQSRNSSPRRVMMPGYVQQTWQGITVNDGEIFVDEMETKEKELANPSRDMTPEDQKRMVAAHYKLDKEYKLRHSQISIGGGEKERNYFFYIQDRKRKVLTIGEMWGSEIPTYLDSLPGKHRDRVLYGDHPEIKKLKNGGVELFCQKCRVRLPSSLVYLCLNNLYCPSCVPDYEMCGACNQLKEKCVAVHTFDNKEIMACTTCVRDRDHCNNCGKKMGIEFVEMGRCKSCIETMYDGQAPFRHFSHGMKWVSNTVGETMKSNRVFSCELEALSDRSDWYVLLHKSLPKEIGIGQDGSVGNRNSKPWGLEIQTPRLGGKKGEELIFRATRTLKDINAHIDESCGMHIHLDGKGIMPVSRKQYPIELLQLWKVYLLFEDVFLSFLPYSRRGNDYCRPLVPAFKLLEIDAIETVFEAEKLWYEERTYPDVNRAKNQNRHPSRYFGANFHSLLKDGHFEVRFHSGTLNPKKVLEWANLHALIMDACTKRLITHDFIKEVQSVSRLSEKTKLLFSKIGLAGSSCQYFFSRQNKFGDRKNRDEEVAEKKERPFDGLEALLVDSPTRRAFIGNQGN